MGWAWTPVTLRSKFILTLSYKSSFVEVQVEVDEILYIFLGS